MTSKRSLRVDGLQRSISKNRTWVTALLSLFAFMWFGIIELLSINVAYSGFNPDTDTKADIAKELWGVVTGFLGLGSGSYFLALTMAVFLGVQGFTFLFDSKKVDFYFSQPVKKMQYFMAIYVNGIIQYACIMGGGFLLGLIIAAARGAYFAALIPAMILEFINLSVQFLCIYTISIFATILCGNLFMGLCSVCFFMFAEIVIRLLVMVLESVYFRSYYQDFAAVSFGFTSPILNYVNFLRHINLADMDYGSINVIKPFLSGMPMLIINLVITAVFLCLTWFVYKNRKNENAGKSVAVTPAENLYKIVTAMIGGIGMELMINAIMNDDSIISFSGLIAMAFGIFAVCVVAEGVFACNVKSIFRRAWHMPLIFVACILILAGFKYDVFGYDSYLPKADRVESVSMVPTGYYDFRNNYNGSMYLSSDDEDDIMAKEMVTGDRDAALALAKEGLLYTREKYGQPGYYNSTQVFITYNMKNGKKIRRNVYIPVTIDKDVMNTLLGEDHYAEAFVGLPVADERVEDLVKNISFKVDSGITGLSDYYEDTEGKTDLSEGLSGEESKKLFREFEEVYRADVDEHFDYDTILDQRAIMRVTFTGESESNEYGEVVFPVFENYDRTISFMKNHGIVVSDEEYAAYVENVLGYVDSIEIAGADYYSSGSEDYDDEYYEEDQTGASYDSSNAAEFTDPDEIREILLSAGQGSMYGPDNTMPFADNQNCSRITIYNKAYGYISSFSVKNDRLPEFVKH